VLTDWAMPIFDGLELAQMIRQPGANANPYVPIIMLTGHSEKKRVIASRDAGVTEFLAKPISAKGLYQRVLNVVANPRPFIRTRSYFGPDRRRNTNPHYAGPERRKGGKADIIKQQPLLEKARTPA
jgi:DNA-binding response OmpR family regulator